MLSTLRPWVDKDTKGKTSKVFFYILLTNFKMNLSNSDRNHPFKITGTYMFWKVRRTNWTVRRKDRTVRRSDWAGRRSGWVLRRSGWPVRSTD